jgi:hypothetical protein
MHCIFCKGETSGSYSEEHIIPESLGNIDHVLPPGVVCDKCNNYLAREVEKPFLDSRYFQERRFHFGIPNKKKRIPPMEGIHLQSGTKIQFVKLDGEENICVGASPNTDESRWVRSILSSKSGTVIMPIGEKPNEKIISRFIGKIGLEVLAHRMIDVPGGIEEIVNKRELDELRNYVRIGNSKQSWPYSCRSIYTPEFIFSDGNEQFQVIHEFDILVTPESEFYIVVAIFGEEYVLNLGGPEMDGYELWLKENNNISPLYSNKNA